MLFNFENSSITDDMYFFFRTSLHQLFFSSRNIGEVASGNCLVYNILNRIIWCKLSKKTYHVLLKTEALFCIHVDICLVCNESWKPVHRVSQHTHKARVHLYARQMNKFSNLPDGHSGDELARSSAAVFRMKYFCSWMLWSRKHYLTWSK